MYEIYERLRDQKKLKNSDISRETGVPNMTLSDWKHRKSKPKLENMKKLANFFEVTVDFINGDTDMVVCPVCGFGNNPLSEQSRNEHEEFHNNYLLAKEKYDFITPYSEANKLHGKSIDDFRNPSKSTEDKLFAFEECLKAEFSLEVIKRSYNIENLDYEEFCKAKASSLNPDLLISEELVGIIMDKYGIDRQYIVEKQLLLSRASESEQLMRILRYAERLSPEILNSIEIQMKALSENNQG